MLFLTLLLSLSNVSLSWGPTGHRVVGLIAEQHLSKKALKNIASVLGSETIAEVSTYMDFIRSDRRYNHYGPFHYCTVPDGKTYRRFGIPDEGDAVVGIERFISELKKKEFKEFDEAFALKCLIHLIGDIHQPLHVGNGEDRGGNDIKLEFFYHNSNLHRVWDSGLIDQQKYSYTEYTNWINHPTVDQKRIWSSEGIDVWVQESYDLRKQVYDFPENKKLSWRYNYDNIDSLNRRLLQAGIRLAAVLEDIYG